jgi:hypothetical protein
MNEVTGGNTGGAVGDREGNRQEIVDGVARMMIPRVALRFTVCSLMFHVYCLMFTV